MTRKTKPIYLLIAGALLLVVASIFIFLLIRACNVNTTNNVATLDEEILRYSKIYAESTKDSVAPTDESTENTTAIDNVIKAKGLCVDKSGNVYDSKENKYTVTDGHIAIVYEGNVYKISVKYIKEVNPKDKKSESKPKAITTPTEKEKQKTQQNYPSNNSSSNNQSQTSSSVSVSQNGNVNKETTSTPVTENIKMSYSALTVNCDTVFNLALIGAKGDVTWGFENNLVKVVRPIGNECSFKAIEKGTVRVVAVYKGNRYYCTVTIN